MALKTANNPVREKMVKALAFQKAGEIEKAQRLYKQVLKKAPNQPDANHLLGVCYRQLGYPKRAIEYIQKAINQANDRAPFYANLARAMSDIPNSDTKSILAMTQKALSLDPTLLEARNLHAISLSRLEMKEEAETIFQQLIVEYPNYTEAYRNYGIMLRDNKDFDKAATFFFKCTKLEPDNPENHVQRIRALLEISDFETAQREVEAALERLPGNGDLLHELARLMFKIGESVRGLEAAEAAVKADPNNKHKLVTLGVIQHGLCKYEDAIRSFNRALDASQTPLPAAEWNLSLAYLGSGQLAEGWDRHGARFFEGHTTVLNRKFEKPQWDGSDISDKTILVWNDQGVGDALRMGTMIPEIIAKAGHVIIEVSEKLIPPFRDSFADATTRLATFETGTLRATSDDYDCHISMADLARFFRRDVESFKRAKHPVYKVSQSRVREFYDRIPDAGTKPIVGVSWRSRNLAAHRAKNYLSAPDFAPIVEVQDVIFLNLQYLAIAKEIRFLQEARHANLIHFNDVDQFNNLQDAAALANCCDLIISANTSVAEMAGCQNIPCWTFGDPASHFQLGQDTPPWYNHMTYTVLQPGHYVVELVPELIERLEAWKETFDPAPRMKRVGL
ncbi:tetratricopeptide repeat protein [Roseibium sp.]|uniref:tetratricopeptide repeat protein n=1 Tax=Roseibium sp. TaxID=1936156 RepID=UPI003A984DFB